MMDLIYKDPKQTTRDPKLLSKRAGVTLTQAKKFLNQQIGNIVNEKSIAPPVGSSK